MTTDGLCAAFITHYGYTYRCQLSDGHGARHRGVGQNPGVYSRGGGVLFWNDSDPGANGQFRHPADNAGTTPFTGHDPLAPTGDG